MSVSLLRHNIYAVKCKELLVLECYKKRSKNKEFLELGLKLGSLQSKKRVYSNFFEVLFIHKVKQKWNTAINIASIVLKLI